MVCCRVLLLDDRKTGIGATISHVSIAVIHIQIGKRLFGFVSKAIGIDSQLGLFWIALGHSFAQEVKFSFSC